MNWSFQKAEAEIQRGQLALAGAIGASQERLAQSKQASDLLSHLVSRDAKLRLMALRILNRSVSAELYSDILSAMAVGDTDEHVRKQAISLLANASNLSTAESMKAVSADASKTEAERALAKKTADSVLAKYESQRL